MMEELNPGLYFSVRFFLQSNAFSNWACLDSNQGPLPYQGGGAGPAAYRSVRESGINKAIRGFCANVPVRCIPPRIARVGVTVGVRAA
jgi:hypothetical protein